MYHPELFISVDSETDGAIPGPYSMLSTGAVVVDGIFKTDFYVELRPISNRFDPEALAISGLDRNHLIREGTDPVAAMRQFEHWVQQVCAPTDAKPVFVGFNAPFDWSFNHWYFVNFLDRDPFGFSGLDIKAYYMGARQIERWSDTTKSKLEDPFKFDLGHNAVEDAREQAKAFWRMRQANRP